MPTKDSFETVFKKLRAILQPYESRLILMGDGAEGYSLNTPFSEKYQKEVFFAGVQIKKNYVSFHLMPIYAYVDMVDGISPELKKRKQGKACFNFTKVDDKLFSELADLT